MKARVADMNRLIGVAFVLAGVVLGTGCLTSSAKAATPYDGLLHKAPALYVYTDGSAKTQTMGISGSWWSDFKQAFAKRLDQGLGWPSDFVPQFESFMASGSWAVVIDESPDGMTVSLFGTSDPNAYCDFSDPTAATPSGNFGCTSHAGYDYATAGYFTHNSFGGNGCIAFSPVFTNFCTDNGMAIYDAPTVGHAATDNRFWVRNMPGSLNFYRMNFDVHYPDGYAGEQIGTKPVPPPTTCPAVKLIGLAGSGENYGPGTGRDHRVSLGRPVQAFSDALESRVETTFGPGSYGPDVAIDYPAAAVGLSFDLDGAIKLTNDLGAAMHSGDYQSSVNRGVAALIQQIQLAAPQVSGACKGKTRIVLAGYSQGAQVIGDVLSNWRTNFPRQSKKLISNVVLFGDPEFNANASSVSEKATFDSSKSGILGARSPGALSGFRTTSFCRAADPVCQGAEYLPNFGEPHFHYQEFESLWAANGVATDTEVATGVSAQRRMSVSLSATLDPTGTKVNLDCVLRDASSLVVVIPAGATCQVRGSITLTASGGKSLPFQTSVEDAWRFVGGPFAKQQVDISDLLNRLPACADPFGSCTAKRRVQLFASLSAVASAEGYGDEGLRMRRYPLAP